MWREDPKQKNTNAGLTMAGAPNPWPKALLQSGKKCFRSREWIQEFSEPSSKDAVILIHRVHWRYYCQLGWLGSPLNRTSFPLWSSYSWPREEPVRSLTSEVQSVTLRQLVNRWKVFGGSQLVPVSFCSHSLSSQIWPCHPAVAPAL